MSRSLTLVGLAVLGLSTTSASAAIPGDSDPYASCRQSEKAASCFDRIEARLLAKTQGRVKRSGRQLHLLPAHGSPVVLTDDTEAEEQYVRYRYRGYLSSIGQHLIDVALYEARGFWLVDARTGRLTKLGAVPVVSPDRRRFVTASLDLDAGIMRNALQVWRLTDDGPELEFNLDGGWTWGPSDPVWRDDHTIEFVKNVAAAEGNRPAPSRVRLVLESGGWSIQETQSNPPRPKTPAPALATPRSTKR